MADITTFYPGGVADEAIPHAQNAANATNAVNAVNADQVDYVENIGGTDMAQTGLIFWVGAESNAPAAGSRDDKTLYIFTS